MTDTQTLAMSVCSNYNPKRDKTYNNNKVADGWHLRQIPWNKPALEAFVTTQGVSGNEFAGTKRLKAAWVGTHSIMLDFDNGVLTSQVLLEKQAAWKFDSYVYTSQNHQKKEIKADSTVIPPRDKLRVIIPLLYPIRTEKDRNIVERLFFAKFEHSIDNSFMEKSRYFAHGNIDHVSSIVSSNGFLNWKELPGFGGDFDLTDDRAAKNKQTKEERAQCVFSFNDVTRDRFGNYKQIRDITIGDSLYCPKCGEAEHRSNLTHNAVLGINAKGIPMLFCSSCKSRKMGIAGKGVYNLNLDEAYYFKTKSQDFENFIFLDIETQKYMMIREHPSRPKSGDPYIHSIADHKLMQHCFAFDLPVPKTWPQMLYKLDFGSDLLINESTNTVNKYIAPSIIKTEPIVGAKYKLPKYIGLLADHVMAHDKEIQDKFYNDLAYVLKHREKLITAFLFQGTEGTGKGILFEFTIRQIFGELYTTTLDQDNFSNQFNSVLEDNVFAMVNEVSGDFGRGKGSGVVPIIEKIKQAITDIEGMSIERKGKDRYTGKNWCNFLFSTNAQIGLTLSKEDRRFNVAPRQNVKIFNTAWWKEVGGWKGLKKAIEAELEDFVCYLKMYDIDYDQIAKTIDNPAKRALQSMASTSSEDFFLNIKVGDTNWLDQNIMKQDNTSNIDLAQKRYEEIRAIVDSLPNKGEEGKNTPSEHILKIYNYMFNKKLNLISFGKVCAGYLGPTKSFRDATTRRVVRGYYLPWKPIEEFDLDRQPQTELQLEQQQLELQQPKLQQPVQQPVQQPETEVKPLKQQIELKTKFELETKPDLQPDEVQPKLQQPEQQEQEKQEQEQEKQEQEPNNEYFKSDAERQVIVRMQRALKSEFDELFPERKEREQLNQEQLNQEQGTTMNQTSSTEKKHLGDGPSVYTEAD